MRSPQQQQHQQRRDEKGKDGGDNVDIEVLRKEYRNMQANRNAFAHESDLVRVFISCLALRLFPFLP